MADISQHLKAIQTAKYGEEVRGSIHDALEAMNKESSSAKEVAETAQDSAKASATAAANSASSAKTSETNAKSSETKSKTSETNAANSASSASTSASNAASSASAAKTSETNAKTSETNAKSSETKAKASEQVIEQFALYLSFFDALKEAVEACIFPSALLDSDGNPILDSDGASITTETKGLDGFRNALINVPTDVFALSQQMKHCIMDSND